jgi:hypothetical protein
MLEYLFLRDGDITSPLRFNKQRFIGNPYIYSLIGRVLTNGRYTYTLSVLCIALRRSDKGIRSVWLLGYDGQEYYFDKCDKEIVAYGPWPP